MATTMRSRLAYESPVVRVREVICRPHDSACSCAECSDEHSIVFVRRGAFVKHVRGRAVVADANQVLVFQRGEEYRVSHPVAGGDDCLSFSLPDAILLDMLRSHDPAVDERPERPFARASATANGKIDLAQRALFRAMVHVSGPDLELDEMILTLLGRAVAPLCGAEEASRSRRRLDTTKAHRDLSRPTDG